MSQKIALIGAGSVVFAKTLIGDILQQEALADSEMRLMDIDPARLRVAEEIVRRMIAQLKVKARVVATLDRTEAIRGANFVICTIQVGGYKPGTVTDFEIPKKYGLRATIADTLGIGGIFRGLRTAPELLTIARDIAEAAAPGCLLLNYSNPMAILCWAVARGVGIPAVGLCHSVQGTSHQLAGYAGLDMDGVTYRVAGINHMAFFLEFNYQGRDAYPLLFAKLKDSDFHDDKVRFEMMRRLGYFVTESSEHQAEYVPYFIPHGDEMIGRFDVPLDEYIRRCEAGAASWAKTERQLLGSDARGISVAPPSNEYGSYIIHSIVTDTPRVVYGNVVNHALIPNLPEGCIVETPDLVDAKGVQGTRIGDFPEHLAAICRTNINVQALAVEAALTGRREAIYHAAMLDPLASATLKLDEIWALCDELIEAHQGHGLLREFTRTIQGTGRSWEGTADRIIVRLDIAGPLPDDAGGVLALRAVADWQEAKPRRLDLRMVLPAQCRLPGDETVVLEPGARHAEFEVEVQGALPVSGLRIDLDCDDRDVLPLGVVLRRRTQLDVRDDREAAVEVQLAGFPAAKVAFRRCNGAIALKMRINDSEVSPEPSVPIDGSGLELFVSDTPTAKPALFCLVPCPARGGIDLYRKTSGAWVGEPVEGTLAIEPLSYEMNVLLPRNVIDPSKQRVYVDLIANLSALGDAHSGGRSSLSGNFEAYLGSERAAELVLQ